MHITIKNYESLPLSTFLLIALIAFIVWQPAIAQPSSLPSCTDAIADTDDDGVPAIMDIDKDGDGLIELCSLEGLDAIRHQLDGMGYRASTATLITTGCPEDGCRGYELVRSLDFADAGSYRSGRINTAWTTGEGWLPIGISGESFNAVFEGNGHTISNLTIDRSADNVGLFGDTGTTSKIINIGLLGVAITGNNSVGSLVGRNNGRITNSYATGDVRGEKWIGGLVGTNQRGINNSYATSAADGRAGGLGEIGGLVGRNEGSITNSYATGAVTGDQRAGGLVGLNSLSGSITNSYATGAVRGTSGIGGLVGSNSGSATNSYATGSVRGSNFIDKLVGIGSLTISNKHLSIEELQSPITATGVYMEWSTANWDFGNASQSPVLKYTSGADANNPACGGAGQPSCGNLLADQFRSFLDKLTVSTGLMTPEFDPQRLMYVVTVGETVNSITLQATAADSLITVRSAGLGEQATTGTISQNIPLNQDDVTLITIEVFDGIKTGNYMLTVEPINVPHCTLDIPDTDDDGVPAIMDIDKDGDRLIEICDLEGLDAIRYQLGGRGYQASPTADLITTGCRSCQGYELVRSLDFADAGSYRSGRINTAWTTGAGWLPIGSGNQRFTAIFEGNNHTISNLMIDRLTDNIGLFGSIIYDLTTPITIPNLMPTITKIANIGLLDVVIAGNNQVGGLVGNNIRSIIVNSYVTGDVTGQTNVGGLVGTNGAEGNVINSYATGAVAGHENVGGLVGTNDNNGIITNSYATSDVTGQTNVGGLVGLSIFSSVTNSYAIGDVRGNNGLGGLVGLSFGQITNSYAIGAVTGQSNVGGLVGNYQADNSGTSSITNSYAAGDVAGNANALVGTNTNNGITNSEHLSVAALQMPTTATGIYGGWDATNWDFGNTSQFPALKYTSGTDDDNPNCDADGQPSCSSLLPNQFPTPLDRLSVSNGLLVPAFNPRRQVYDVVVDNTVNPITLQAMATDKSITIRSNDSGEQAANDSINQDISITTGDGTTITIEVSESDERLMGSYLLTVKVEILPSCTLSIPDTDSDGVPRAVDIDKDGDGLIELCDLEGLDAIRHQLNGRGYQANSTATRITTGCPRSGCRGYELVRSLDFDETNSYRSGRINTAWTMAPGWLPIGTFNAAFEGNDNTISNLTINRSADNIGLFAETGTNSRMTNIGLLDMVIRGNNRVGSLVGLNDGGSIANSYAVGNVTGRASAIGGLVGLNDDGSITNSYAMGSVTGRASAIGGLVGLNLVGENADGSITNSYATNNVIGGNQAGGLVGENGGSVTNSYATGDVTGQNDVGGLVGENGSPGSIANSYATGDVTGGNRSGSLVGENSGTIMNSYAAGDVNGQGDASVLSGSNPSQSITDSSHQSIAQLQSPITTTTTNIYSEWNTADWDFGNTTQFPALKYTRGSDADSPACGVAGQPSCGSLLSNQPNLLNSLTIPDGLLVPDFKQQRFDYDVVVGEMTDSITLQATATDKSITLRSDRLDEQVTNDSINQNIPITAGSVTAITIEVSQTNGRSTGIYRLTVQVNLLPSCTLDIPDIDNDGVSAVMDVDKDGDGLIELCDLEGLDAIRHQLDGSGYQASSTATLITTGCPTDGCRGYELVRSLDFAETNSYRNGRINTAWTTDAGWLPIGTSREPFNAIFEGNSHTISSLMIDRRGVDDIGLFGVTSSDSMMTNIGLLNVVIRGRDSVGGLVGENAGSITNSYATGDVTGTGELGSGVGGLVGTHAGNITNSYASIGNVTGDTNVGGLVGLNGGSITNSYATNDVNGQFNLGGLVGYSNIGNITNSYATGNATGSSNVGSLVGRADGDITNSYATGDATGSSNVGGLIGLNMGSAPNSRHLSIAELQSPTMATDIYREWDAESWDFGNESQYPALKYTSGTNASNPACGFAGQPSCGSLLPNQFPSLLDNLTVSNGLLTPALNPQRLVYDVGVPDTVNSITLQAMATDKSITIRGDGLEEQSSTDNISRDIPATADDMTTIKIEVSAPGERSAGNYRLILSPVSDDPSLSDLTLMGANGTSIRLTETFAPEMTAYTARVANAIAQVRVMPTTTHPGATITVNSNTMVSDDGDIALTEGGVTTITIVVTAQDGEMMETYTIAVTRLLSDDSSLSDLVLTQTDGDEIDIGFLPDLDTYRPRVASRVDQVRVMPTANHPNATITVNGISVDSGDPSGNIDLIEDRVTTITIVVTAQNGRDMTNYTIFVMRLSGDANLSDLELTQTDGTPIRLTETFAPETTTYTASIAIAQAQVRVVPTASHPDATITVDNIPVARGDQSGNIPLTADAVTTITIEVTAEDGIVTRNYAIAVPRLNNDASLSDLVLTQTDGMPIQLDEMFAPTTTTYRVSVPNTITQVQVMPTTTDPNATIRVDVGTVASVDQSGNIMLTEGGVTTITIVVTAEDRVTAETYTIAVTRAPSADASLSALTISSGILNPGFSSTQNYTVSVENGIERLTVMPTTTNPNATIRVASETVASGESSGEIALTEGGVTTITIVVTAQDRQTTETYTIAVARDPSSDTRLSRLELVDVISDNETAINISQESTTTYTVRVENTVAQVRVMPTANHPNATITVGEDRVASGGQSEVIDLTEGGVTTITIVVTAQDRETTETYTVAVTRDPSSDASLRDLAVSAGELTPPFMSDQLTYSVLVANATATITVSPTKTHPNATIRVGSQTVVSGESSGEIDLIEDGVTMITIVVTAQDGRTNRTYAIAVTRAPSSDASLSNLVLMQTDGMLIQLDEMFAPTTTTYTANVANAIDQVRVMPTTAHPDAAIRVGSETVASGGSSVDILLTAGEVTTITIEVTAQDRVTTRNYIIAVARAPSSDASLSGLELVDDNETVINIFQESTTTYTVNVPNMSARVRVIPMATQGVLSTIRVSAENFETETVASDSATTEFVPLAAVGEETTISIVVTAPDGETEINYRVSLIRVEEGASDDASLSGLVLRQSNGTPIPLDETFASTKTTYRVNVQNMVAQVQVMPTTTDPSATIRVNGGTMDSGESSEAIGLTEGGVTMITIVVTARDRVTTETYTVNVRRAPSSDASLSNLVLTQTDGTTIIPLTETFATPTTTYTAEVENMVAQVRVMPTANQPNATITVDEDRVASGGQSEVIDLTEDEVTTITIEVTAQDDETTETYTIAVTRAPSSDASLSALTISEGRLNPVFDSDTRDYRVEVANATATVTVSPTATHPNATITVDSNTMVSDGRDIALTEGRVTTITIVVTAQDKQTTETYTIAVARAPSRDASLNALTVSEGRLNPVFNSNTRDYRVEVANATATITVIPIASHPRAVITVNGATVNTSEPSQLINLTEGDETNITIEVVAQDGMTTNSYIVTVSREPSRNASLSNLVLTQLDTTPIQLDERFTPTTTTYTAEVANTVAQVRVIPTLTNPNATITVDDNAVSDGTPSGGIELTEDGVTMITIEVTAQDGETTKTYTVAVSRAPSSDASLSGLLLTQLDGTTIQLDQTFAPTTTTYTVSVSARQVRVIPTATHPEATITVDGKTVVSDTMSGNITLAAGRMTTIPIEVTAQDRVTISNYEIVVTRATSSDASLSDLELVDNEGRTINLLQQSTTTYTVSVSARQVRVKPTATEGNQAKIVVSADNFVTETVVSGAETTAFVPLAEIGARTIINIVVTAPDGIAEITYRIAVLSVVALWRDFPSGARAVCDDADIDNDDDGLIEICYLEDVDAIRYRLDGSGYQPSSTATLITTGCGGGVNNDICNGYELVRDLDFDDEGSYKDAPANKSSWTTGAGWPYIGSETPGRDSSSHFSGILEGNGHTIANLFVNAPTGNERHGRFIQVIAGTVRNLGLKDVDITITESDPCPGSTVPCRGAIFTYEMIGTGRITNCYVSGVSNNSDTGDFSTFALDNNGKISNSYVNIEFSGPMFGLFVGNNRAESRIAEVSNSYIIGDARNATVISNGSRAFMSNNNRFIENVYYAVQTNADAGPHAIARANNEFGEIRRSYFDNDKWRGNDSITINLGTALEQNSDGYSTEDLQMPTAANPDDMDSPYYQWSEDNWSFGISEQYPLVKYGSGDDPANPACGNSQQPQCGTLLREQTLAIDATLDDLMVSAGTLSPAFMRNIQNYTVSVANATATISFTPTAHHPDATITVDNIRVDSGNASDNITLPEGATTTITVVVNSPAGIINTYSIAVTRVLSKIATLNSLMLTDSAGDTPVRVNPDPFDAGTFEYNAQVQDTVSMVTVTVLATDENAEIRVDSDEVESSTSFDVELGNPGSDTVIEIEVTAQDGMTTNTYTITVNRAEPSASNDAGLFDLALMLTDTDGTKIELSPAFASTRTSYSADVTHTVDTIAVTPTANNNNAMIVANGIAVRSGDSTEVRLRGAGDSTDIVVRVTAEDGIAMASYTVTVNRALSNDASLSALMLTDTSGEVTLTPVFTSTETNYIASVAETVNQVQVTLVATEGTTATIRVGGVTVTSGGSLNVELGATGTDTAIEIVVTAPNGTTTNSYTVTVRHAPSSDATLANLTVSEGELTPRFSSNQGTYSVSVDNNIGRLTITPTANHPSATITVNDAAVDSDSASDSIALIEGSTTTITIVVTAQDNTMNTYTIEVSRAASTDATLSELTVSEGELTPAFTSDQVNYSVSVTNTTATITVTPTATNENATITVNETDVNSENTNVSIALTEGSTTTITIMVTAQDGSLNTYTVSVTRAASPDATLTDLVLRDTEGNIIGLTPAFASTRTDYIASVAHTIAQVQVMPVAAEGRLAMIMVDDRRVDSGDTTNISLGVRGTNTAIEILVTAPNGTTTNSYTVTVRRAFSNVASLDILEVSQGTLMPAFNSSTLTYTVMVDNTIEALTVMPTATDDNATITVDGNTVSSGTPSRDIPLTEGEVTTITIVVTAQEDDTEMIYTIAVNRAPSNVASLAALAVSPGALMPTFNSSSLTYTVMVDNNIEELTVMPTATNSNAMITVDGIAVASESASRPIELAEGEVTTITIVVTAQDDVTEMIYTIAVDRAPSSDASLSALAVSQGELMPAFDSNTSTYTVMVENDIDRLTVMPTATNANATITVDNNTVLSGAESVDITLIEGGVTTITIVVTAQNRRTMRAYTIAVDRAPSSDATLNALTLTDRLGATPVIGDINSFRPDTLEYTARVLHTVSTVTVTVLATDNENAEIRVDGTIVASGADIAVPLAEAGASTDIEIVVTAQDRMTSNTYVITVMRNPVPPPSDATLFNLALMGDGEAIGLDFDSMVSTYTVSVAHTVDTLTVTPTANNDRATIEVNGMSVESDDSTPVTLEGVDEGESTNVVVIVTAADRITIASYTVTVTRALSNDATLATLMLIDTDDNMTMIALTPDFASEETNYIASVAETVDAVQVMPVATEGTRAVIMVNDNPVASSASINVRLGATGTDTAIEIVVTAPNAITTNSYTVTVRRAPSSDATLSDLTVSAGILTPAFMSTTRSYTVSVVNDIEELTVTPSANHPNATIIVNGRDVNSGNTSQPIELAEGKVTTITVVVTAQNGNTTQSYTIAVSRAPSADASLSNLMVSPGTLSETFGSTTLNYTVSVANATPMITVTPTATNENAAITVDDERVDSGSPSNAISLAEGEVTTITIVVTAQDGTTNTYTIAVTRAPSSDASLSDLKLVLTDDDDANATVLDIFEQSRTIYMVEVPTTATQVRVMPTATNANATITVNGGDVNSGNTSQPIELAEGQVTRIMVVVTAQNDTMTPYTIEVTRARSGIRVRVKVFLEGPLR